MTYWLDDNNWDCPTIYNRKWEEVDRLCVCEDDMRSFVVLNGKIYFSEYGQAHYGAIINGLLDIHHLKTVEQLEKKFKEDIDYIVDEVRYNDDGEGRIWDRWNLIQITGTNDYTSEQIYDMIAQQLGVPKESFNVLDYSKKQRLNDCPKIVKYNQLKKDIESVNESVGAVGDNVFDDYGVDYIVNAFKHNYRLWYPLINAASYQKSTQEFVKYGKFIHFPEDLIDRWIGIVFRNTAILNTLSDIIGAGNGLNDMFDTFVDKLGGEYKQKWNSEYQSKLSNIEYDEDGSDENGYTEDGNILEMRYDFLEDIGYIGWSRMPDGSLGKTDFGMYDLFEVLEDYDDKMTPEQVFVIINRALDVTHQSGDMASIFIEGGASTLNKISNGGVVEKLSRSSFDMMIQESLSRVLNEGASCILYHWLNFDRFESLVSDNAFHPSDQEQKFNGKDTCYISMTRVRTIREGWPVLMYSAYDGKGDSWCAIRLTIDGNLINTKPNFKVDGKQHNMRSGAFDWAYHEHDNGNPYVFADEHSGIFANNGKEWMMQSDADTDIYANVGYAHVGDKQGHPYSQAEDRLITTSPIIPNAIQYIKRIDVLLFPYGRSEAVEYGDYQKMEQIYKSTPFGKLMHFYKDANSFDRQDNNEVDLAYLMRGRKQHPFMQNKRKQDF